MFDLKYRNPDSPYPAATDDTWIDPLKLGKIGDRILKQLEGLTDGEAELTLAIAVKVFINNAVQERYVKKSIAEFANHLRFIYDQSKKGPISPEPRH